MKTLIQFELKESYYEHGYNDGKTSTFDTWYIEKPSNDATLSYVAGFNKAREEMTTTLKYNESITITRI